MSSEGKEKKKETINVDGEDVIYADWNEALERVIQKEGEQSESLFWLHNQACTWASKRNDYIQIPSIVLASVTGFLSATSDLLPPVAIGALSLSVALLNTINSYYKYSQRSEAHKITAQLYMKSYKNIETELALPQHQRVNAAKLLQELRDSMARISEVAPAVPEAIIAKYKAQFKDTKTSKPIIANGLDSIAIFRHVKPKEKEVEIAPVTPIPPRIVHLPNQPDIKITMEMP